MPNKNGPLPERNLSWLHSQRRHLITLAALLAIVISVLAVFSLFAIDSLEKAANQQRQTSEESRLILHSVRSAQVSLRVQVQEWKNLLLRGDDPQDYKKYSAALYTQNQAVTKQLNAVKQHVEHLGISPERVDIVLQQHNKLYIKYREAVADFSPRELASIQATDQQVRGADRPFNQQFRALLNEIYHRTEARQKLATEEFTSTVNLTHKAIIFSAITSLFLAAFTLILALRVIGRR